MLRKVAPPLDLQLARRHGAGDVHRDHQLDVDFQITLR